MMSVAFHQKLPSNKTEGFNVPKTITAFFFLKKIKEQLMLQMEATVYRLPMAQFWGEMEKKNTPIDAANESAPNHRIGKNVKKELENSGAHIQQRKDQYSARGTKRTIFPQKGTPHGPRKVG